MWVVGPPNVEPFPLGQPAQDGGAALHYLVAAGDHTVGRPPKNTGDKSADVLLPGDASVSKEHVKLTVLPSPGQGQPQRLMLTGEWKREAEARWTSRAEVSC